MQQLLTFIRVKKFSDALFKLTIRYSLHSLYSEALRGTKQVRSSIGFWQNLEKHKILIVVTVLLL